MTDMTPTHPTQASVDEVKYPEGFGPEIGLPAWAMQEANATAASLTGERKWDVPCIAAALVRADATCALRGAQKESGWRPIETAPTDRRILLYWTHAGAAVGQYCVDDTFAMRDARRWKCPETGWRCDGDQVIPINQEDCTHWMPLPSPPTPEGEAK